MSCYQFQSTDKIFSGIGARCSEHLEKSITSIFLFSLKDCHQYQFSAGLINPTQYQSHHFRQHQKHYHISQRSADF